MADDKPDYGSWIPVHVAVERAAKYFGVTDGFAAIWPRIRDGLIAACTMRSATKMGMNGTAEPRLEPRSISPANWAQYSQNAPRKLSYLDEVTFVFRPEGYGYGTDQYVTCYDVRLDPAALERECPAPAVPAEPIPTLPATVVATSGGRPRATWREPLLIELAGQMLDGDLKPNRLADLEKAAMEWLGAQNEYPSERIVRDVVRPLLVRYQQEGKNPKA